MTPLAAQLLPPRHARIARASLPVTPGMEIAPGRAHEICGGARRQVALRIAAAATGAVVWIAPGWQPGHPCPSGIARWLDPGRLLYVLPDRREDLLWAAEEALRANAAAFVVADLPDPPGLTPIRRLHLAAEAGGHRSERAPTGLVLTPEGAAPGIETRWSARPAARAGEPGWQLSLLRARDRPPSDWWTDFPPPGAADGPLELARGPG